MRLIAAANRIKEAEVTTPQPMSISVSRASDRKAAWPECASQMAKASAGPAMIAVSTKKPSTGPTDNAGRLVMLHRLDDAQNCSIIIAQEKARTAVDFKRPTKRYRTPSPR